MIYTDTKSKKYVWKWIRVWDNSGRNINLDWGEL